jgi:5-(carboxyamino)imidazole ribonucleotide synthase
MPTSQRPRILAPGATIGMIGGGQLGRMFASVARRCGYRIHVFGDPDDSPAGQLSDRVWDCALDDLDAVREFARTTDGISYEFENIPVATVHAAAEVTPVFPGPQLLEMAQHRVLEKTGLRKWGIPTTDFHPITNVDQLTAAVADFGSGILKTATMGYDGKGQVRVSSGDDLSTVWSELDCAEAILERFVDFQFEMSVVAARFTDGKCTTYEPVVNEHVNHILDVSVSPSPDVQTQSSQAAQEIAITILEKFNVFGVLCVEFFVTGTGDVLVNEIAPRPHNSGHLTIEACASSQFEQQLRAVCGLASGDVTQPRPAAMANLLGDHLSHATPERWKRVFAMPDVFVHLYGKGEARTGRKMGHLTAIADSAETARTRVLEARSILTD